MKFSARACASARSWPSTSESSCVPVSSRLAITLREGVSLSATGSKKGWRGGRLATSVLFEFLITLPRFPVNKTRFGQASKSMKVYTRARRLETTGRWQLLISPWKKSSSTRACIKASKGAKLYGVLVENGWRNRSNWMPIFFFVGTLFVWYGMVRFLNIDFLPKRHYIPKNFS